MYKRLFLSALTAFAFAGAAQANMSRIINFETAADRAAFDFNKFEVIFVETADSPAWSGFQSGMGSWAATNPVNPSGGLTSSFTSKFGTFSLDSLFLAAAWGEGTVRIEGFAAGQTTPLYRSGDLSIDMSGKTFEFKDWTGVDRFSISVVNPDGWLYNNPSRTGNAWVLGELTVTPVPEPETYAMLLAGLAILGAVARRRSITASV
jgi:hypothetical protein